MGYLTRSKNRLLNKTGALKHIKVFFISRVEASKSLPNAFG